MLKQLYKLRYICTFEKKVAYQLGIACTPSDLDKTPAKFQNDPEKGVGGVAFTKYPVLSRPK